MKIFAISDLHLSAASNKPMDVFGMQWENHAQRIFDAWQKTVGEDDLVLMPGDHSWGMSLQEAQPDLDAIAAQKGHKVILRGNHDYWWASLSKVNAAAGSSITVLQNNAFRFGSYVLCGTRGWLIPSPCDTVSQDAKIYAREGMRLRMSLQAAQKLRQSGDKLICMLHFPPMIDPAQETVFTTLCKEFAVDMIVFGHLHGPSGNVALEGVYDGIEHVLVSCDHLDFTPTLLYDDTP